MTTYLETLFTEKGIDLDTDLNIEGNIGMSPRVVLEFIQLRCTNEIRISIESTFRKIDFCNGNIMNFIVYIAKGMTQLVNF